MTEDSTVIQNNADKEFVSKQIKKTQCELPTNPRLLNTGPAVNG